MSLTTPDRRQILHWLGILLLLVIVVPFVIYALPGLAGADGSYVVLSGSMEPSIGVGDVVIVDEVEPATIEEGDVITYHRDGAEKPTTHRVVEITQQDGERAFVTQGDNNDQPDASPVPAGALIGEVSITIPYIGYVIEFVNTPTGFIGLVVIPLLLLLISELWSVLLRDETGPNEKQTVSPPENGATFESDRRAIGELSPVSFENANGSANAPVVYERNHEQAPEMERAAAGSSNDESNDGAITLTGTDLQFSLVLLMGITLYAGWVAYNVPEAWSFAVLFGSGIGVVLVGGMYYVAGDRDTTEERRVHDVQSPPVSAPTTSIDPTTNARTDGSSTTTDVTDRDIGTENEPSSEDNAG